MNEPRIIDERDSTDLNSSPRYRVYDWNGPESLDGDVTASTVWEVECDDVWEAIDWCRSDQRSPRPYLSELYAVDRGVGPAGEPRVTLIFLGSIARRPEGTVYGSRHL